MAASAAVLVDWDGTFAEGRRARAKVLKALPVGGEHRFPVVELDTLKDARSMRGYLITSGKRWGMKFRCRVMLDGSIVVKRES